MRQINAISSVVFCVLSALALSSCAYKSNSGYHKKSPANAPTPNYAARLPSSINTTEKVIVVDPRVHVFGAYDASGNLLRAGLATAGASYCPDVKRACKTKAGTFRIQSLGAAGCKSSIYPLPNGGAPMPYCMFFNKNQGLHGSAARNVIEGNASHGCVRVRVQDAEWLRYNFAKIGTKVIVKPY
ncbi:MAG TPA: L,D-transpeptidase [Gammaproteobacteria bacterium]|nr:L,D-transpeptidase [Gammaproteobacteria bacterium]